MKDLLHEPKKLLFLLVGLVLIGAAFFMLQGRIGGAPAPAPAPDKPPAEPQTFTVHWSTGATVVFTWILGGLAVILMVVGLVVFHNPENP